MSTKIFHGMRCPTGDLAAELERLHAQRAAVAEAGEQAIARWYANKAASAIDDGWAKGEPRKAVLLDLMGELLTRQAEIRTTGRRDPMVDTECSVTLIPIEGQVLALPFAEIPALREAATVGLIPFGYWNNTDPDPAVGAEEWAERERLWTAALERDPLHRPGGCGPSIEFLPTAGVPSAAKVLPLLPSRLTRAKRLARLRVMEARVGPEGAGFTPGEIAQISMSDAFVQEVEKMARTLMDQLPRIDETGLIG